MRIIPVVVLLCLAVANDVAACSCIHVMNGDPVKSAVSSAGNTDAVFRGRVVATVAVLVDQHGSVMYKGSGQAGEVQRIVVFRVDEIFKGDIPPLTTLVTGGGGGDCGYAFEPDTDYIVFANKATERRLTALAGSSPALTTSICTETRPAKGAEALRAALAKKFPAREAVWVQWP